MNIKILTLFPQFFESVFSSSILKRAVGNKIVNIDIINIRDFAKSKHKTVDDKPYGGGQGMILKVDVIASALDSIKPKPHSLLTSASGKKYDQAIAIKLAHKNNLAIVCGHYEGVDARVENLVDDVFSMGDFILTGGEIPALVVVDSIIRLLPGVISNESLKSESFTPFSNLLEYPQFTRPKIFRGKSVPKILLSGNHQKIVKWRQDESIKRTQKFRPDLIVNSKRGK